MTLIDVTNPQLPSDKNSLSVSHMFYTRLAIASCRQPTRKRTDVYYYSDVRAYGHLIISPSLSPCLFIQQTELMGNMYIRIPTCVWYSILYDYHSVKRKYRIIHGGYYKWSLLFVWIIACLIILSSFPREIQFSVRMIRHTRLNVYTVHMEYRKKKCYHHHHHSKDKRKRKNRSGNWRFTLSRPRHLPRVQSSAPQRIKYFQRFLFSFFLFWGKTILFACIYNHPSASFIYYSNCGSFSFFNHFKRAYN